MSKFDKQRFAYLAFTLIAVFLITFLTLKKGDPKVIYTSAALFIASVAMVFFVALWRVILPFIDPDNNNEA